MIKFTVLHIILHDQICTQASKLAWSSIYSDHLRSIYRDRKGETEDAPRPGFLQ